MATSPTVSSSVPGARRGAEPSAVTASPAGIAAAAPVGASRALWPIPDGADPLGCPWTEPAPPAGAYWSLDAARWVPPVGDD